MSKRLKINRYVEYYDTKHDVSWSRYFETRELPTYRFSKVRWFFKELFAGFIISCLVFFIVLSFGFYILNPSSIMETVHSSIYKQSSNHYKDNSDVVRSISIVCDLEEGTLDKSRCVYDTVMKFYYYNDSLLDNELFSNPDRVFVHGGVCRHWSVFYSSIFKNIDVSHKFIFTEDHVFLIIKPKKEELEEDWRYIVLDMDEFTIN